MITKIVGLLADPELPTEMAEQISDALPDLLGTAVSAKVNWEVRVLSRQLPLDENGQIVVWKHGDEIISEQGWDYMVCLTELTRRLDSRFVISDVNRAHKAGLVSLPALGPVRLRHHVSNAVVRVLRALLEESLQPERTSGGEGRALRRLTVNVRSPHRSETTDGNGDTISCLPLRGLRGRIRLLSGMVRINRPWRLIPSLSSAFAAAAATAAFGVFFSSIWSLADSLTPLRLIIINLMSVAAMIIWLVAYNGLWEKPGRQKQRRDAAMYNWATAFTLAIGVTCFYSLLFAVTALGAAVVIPAPYLGSSLGHSVIWLDYLSLAWLAASMGTIAGALGSSFEDDSAIRRATYGRREVERYAKTHDDD
ncbi:hypothetical protein [Arthrobacter monumenti]